MNNPRVSVIIPTYNRAHLLAQAIDSVLAQTFRDWELIVVDDGSTDNSAERVKAVDDARLHYLRQSHRGIGAAMNAGLATTRGEYIARLDSDDLWLPEFLQTQTQVLDRQPDIGLVYARAVGRDSAGKALSYVLGIPPRYPPDSFKSMVYDDCTCNITVLVRKACLDRVGPYDESLHAHEDWDIWLRVARHYSFAFTDQVLAVFRRHGGNITEPGAEALAAFMEERFRVLDKLFANDDLPPRIRTMQGVAYSNVHIRIGLEQLQQRQPIRALRTFRQALCISGKPLRTGVQIGWLILYIKVLIQHSWGRRFARWSANWRRQLR